jgi:hypothetical protein
MTYPDNPTTTNDPVNPPLAHANAALIETDEPYPAPLDQLLTLGYAWEGSPEADAKRQALGITQEHVPDLVRMARDRRLYDSDEPELWAQMHAVLALAELDFRPWIGDLLRLFDIEHDWMVRELPEILARAGEAAIEPLASYLHDQSRWMYGRMVVGEALGDVARRSPELRDRVVAHLTDALARAADEDEGLNGSIVSELVELKAVEALPIIRQAFEIDKVEEMVAGDWAKIQRDLGVTPEQKDPLARRSKQRLEEQKREMRQSLPASLLHGAPSPSNKGEQHKKKAKGKRKAAAASRKANRKRK